MNDRLNPFFIRSQLILSPREHCTILLDVLIPSSSGLS